MSQEQLAEAARISVSTVKDFEAERRVPIARSIEAIEEAFIALGIEAVDQEFLGIRVRKPRRRPKSINPV